MSDADRITHECSDLRNAERFVEMHGDDVRFIHAWGKFLVWDGRRWAVDECGRAMALATDTARAMLANATDELNVAQKAFADLKASGDEEGAARAERRMKIARQAFSHAVKTQSAGRLHAMLDLSKSNPSIAVKHDELDANPWLLNVANGTVDLRTAELRPHNRSDLITKLAPVAFDTTATCPTWDTFLHSAQAGNEEMLSFLRRSRGYMLTGRTTEHALFFFFGPSGTGKSTYFVTLHELLGDYAARAPRGLLSLAKGERHSTGLTMLHGSRFVSCGEVQENEVLDEALIKDVTGGEAITARRMREDDWTFVPTHKLVIPGNHKPIIKNFDDAMRRRLRLVPWTVKPAHADKTLPDQLRAELPGILADAVRGCLEWQRDGLGEPLAVRDATDEFQEESDLLAEFFRLHVTFEPEARIPRKQLRVAYESYCEENGMRPVGAKKVAAKLRGNGVTETSVRLPSGKVSDGWKGVRLKDDRERMTSCRGEGTCREQFPIDGSTRNEISLSQLTGNLPLQPPTSLPEEVHCFSDLLGDASGW